MGALKGFVSFQGAATQLTEDMWVLSPLCVPSGRCCGPGERTAYSQFSSWICGGMPEFCEAVVELFCSFATLYLSNLGKNDPGGHGYLFSLISSGPLTNAMKNLHVFMVTTRTECHA